MRQDQPAVEQKTKGVLDYLPGWAATHLRSSQSWKLLFRAWLGAWVSLLLLLPNASLRTLGNTGFFALLTSIFVPAYLPIQMFIYLILTVGIGLGLGWGFGAAAMRAALAVRSQVLLQAALQKVAVSTAGLANPEALYTVDIFEGVFLDVRSSVMFGVFLGVGNFIFALIRAYAPAFAFMSIFGTIAIDIFCTYGPLFPFAEYTILNSLLTAVACYTAIALVLSILVFPETMNHSCLTAVCAELEKMKELIDIQSKVLTLEPEQMASGQPIINKMVDLRRGIVTSQQQLSPRLKFVNYELSWGRFSGDDVKAFEEPLSQILTRIVSFINFANLVGAPTLYQQDISDTAASVQDNVVPEKTNQPTSSFKQPQPTRTPLLRHIAHHNHVAEQKHTLAMSDMLPFINTSTAALRNACSGGISAAKDVLDEVNGCRWTKSKRSGIDVGGSKTFEEALDGAIERLVAELADFKVAGRQAIIGPYDKVIEDVIAAQEWDKLGHVLNRVNILPMRSLVYANFFAANLIMTAHAILSFMEAVRDKCSRRKTNRLWSPREIRAIGKIFMARNQGDDVGKSALGEDGDQSEVLADAEAFYRKDPDSKPPTNILQRSMNAVHLLYKWIQTPQAKFTIKYTLVSVLLWLPSVFTSSANFYYVQKGVWALIMSQTTLNIFASDQIFNYVTRLAGTLLGLVLGLLTWYIGSGSGIGNPYGIAASGAVFLIPVMWLRLFTPPQYTSGMVITGATFALIVGYSWIDGHLETVGNPGIGWSVAWKRWVLVVIGSAASFILMALPPTSGRKAVRLRNALIIRRLEYMYTNLTEAWISGNGEGVFEKDAQRPDTGNVDANDLHEEREKGQPEYGDEEKGATGDAFPRPNDTSPSHTSDDVTAVQSYGAGANPSISNVSPHRSRSHSLYAVIQSIQSLHSLTELAQWEGSLRGKWPVEEYRKLNECSAAICVALIEIDGALTYLNPEWRLRFLHSTKALHPDFISDVISLFSLTSLSLRAGEPMHEVLPQSLMDRALWYAHRDHFMLTKQHEGVGSMENARLDDQGTQVVDGASSKDVVRGDATLRNRKPATIASIDKDSDSCRNTDLEIAKIRSLDYVYYSSGVVAVYQLLRSLDEVHKITKSLCGEVPLKGYENWRDNYEKTRLDSLMY